MFQFYTPLKTSENLGFLMFSGGIKWKHWLEMGWGPCEPSLMKRFAKVVNGF